MPIPNKSVSRRRGKTILVMVNEPEHEELRAAADQAGMALSVFLRVSALAEARRRRDEGLAR